MANPKFVQIGTGSFKGANTHDETFQVIALDEAGVVWIFVKAQQAKDYTEKYGLGRWIPFGSARQPTRTHP